MSKVKKSGNHLIKSGAGLAGSFIGGFIFSVSDIAGIASFADISLAGALSLPYSSAVLIGAIIRCIVADSVGKSIVKLFAMAIVVITKMFTERFSKPKGCGIVTALSVIISGTAVSLLINEFPQKLLFYALYGAISGFVSYSLVKLISDFAKNRVINFSGTAGYTYSIVYIVYISSLYSIDFSGVNMGIILSAFITVMASYHYHSIGGIVCGAVSSCGAFLVSSELGIASSVLVTAGLFTGFVKLRKPMVMSLFFIFACFAGAVLTGTKMTSGMILSFACGTSTFIMLSPYYSDKWVSVSHENRTESHDINSIRMNFLSDAIEAVRIDAEKISAVLSAQDKKTSGHSDPRAKVCSMCYRRSLCGTYACETAGEMIPVLTEDCIHKKEVADELEKDIRNRTAEQLMHLRFSDERELLDEQLKITGEIVRLAGERADIRYSSTKSRQIALNLRNHGMNPKNVTAYYNQANRLIIEIYFDISDIPENRTRICDLISDELEINLSLSAPVSSAKEMRLCLYENPPYEIEIYSSAVCATESKISGDSSSFFADNTGINYVILSDGMGSGKNAAVDSHLVIGMFRRLICGGMDCNSAVRLINSIMVTKSREESFATLDAVRIDLDTCCMTSVKSGAAATIIRMGEDVVKISSPTFPIGINKQAELYMSEYELSEGDMIVMFSDGISENAYMFIKELLLNENDTRNIVREITAKADVFNTSLHDDDVTVIGIKIKPADS